jgi:hypothetical protein
VLRLALSESLSPNPSQGHESAGPGGRVSVQSPRPGALNAAYKSQFRAPARALALHDRRPRGAQAWARRRARRLPLAAATAPASAMCKVQVGMDVLLYTIYAASYTIWNLGTS